MWKLARNSLTLLALLFSGMALTACATYTPPTADHDLARWIANAKQYQQSLPTSHPDTLAQTLAITPELAAQIRAKFDSRSAHTSAANLARWLVAQDGHAMYYDVDANLTPIEAFRAGRGNCLSFTILLTTLAQELGIAMQFNEVDLPDAWSEGEENHVILLRHVNAVFKFGHTTRVFDLAIDQYDQRYPQRIIPQSKAVAMLHNNRAMIALQHGELELANHYLQLAVALAPNHSDLFANLAVLAKREGQWRLAEQALQRALRLNPRSRVAASGLERFYLQQGEPDKAKTYARVAQRAYLQNPYYQFYLAKKQFADGEHLAARKSIRRAKKLYAHDDRFFELASIIEQALGNYRKALTELDHAHKLATSYSEQDRYMSKAVQVAKLIIERDQNQRH